MLTVILLSLLSQNPNNPNEPAYVKAERAALLATFPVEAFPVKAVKSGMWHEPATWSTGAVPGPADNVYIPSNTTVGTDGDVDCNDVRFDGVWRFARDKDMVIRARTVVGPTCASTFDVSRQNDPTRGKVTFVCKAGFIDITKDPREFGGGWVLHATKIWGLEKQGQADFVSAAAGATSVTFSAMPRNWSVGDTIVLAGPQGFEQDEKRTILSISGAQVFFAEPLKYDHTMPDPKVGLPFAINLTRNITFRSENAGYGNTPYARFDSDPAKPLDPVPDSIVKQRGHFMVMGCGVGASEIGYAAFNDLGRTDKRAHLDAVKFKDGKRLLELGGKPSGDNQVGRYAAHFHHGGRQGTPALVKGCAVNGSPGWGFTNHSSNVHFLDCVSYDCIGACFSCEIGDEVGLMQNCAAIRNPGGFADKDGTVNNPDFDREQGFLGGFWFQGSRVRGRNLKAANCAAGLIFWAPSGTQVYSNNPTRNADNIMGSIDPADVDPNGPDAYLLDFLDAATGTIPTDHNAADMDGLLIVASKVNTLVVGPNPAGSRQPGTWKNLRLLGGIESNYSTNQRFLDSYVSAGPKPQAPYIWAFRSNGGDSHSFEFTRCTINNFGQWSGSVAMGVNLFQNSASNQGGLYIGGNGWTNISKIPLRPREVWLDNTVTPMFWEGESSTVMNRVVVDGKQLYGPKSEPEFVPFPTVNAESTPPYYAGKTNAQLLSEYGVAAGGDITPADAVFDAKLGHKVGPVSKRLAVVARNSYQDLKVVRPSGTVAKIPIEVYPPKQHKPVMVNIDHPVKPGWQPVFFDYEGLRYSVNVFGTGSTPPPDPPTPPPLVVTTVEVTPANLTLEVGKTAQLSAVVKDQFGAVMPGEVVSWTSNGAAVAAVNSTGLCTAVSAGNTTITATVEGKQGAANVTVSSPPPPKPKIVKVTIELDDGTKKEFP